MNTNKEWKQRPKYVWPTSSLTEKEMAILYKWRKLTGTPINELIKQAIVKCDRLLQV